MKECALPTAVQAQVAKINFQKAWQSIRSSGSPQIFKISSLNSLFGIFQANKILYGLIFDPPKYFSALYGTSGRYLFILLDSVSISIGIPEARFLVPVGLAARCQASYTNPIS